MRQKTGLADATIDHEIGKAKTMIFKAFDNDIVGGGTLKTFKRVKKLLVPGSDVRDRNTCHRMSSRRTWLTQAVTSMLLFAWDTIPVCVEAKF